MKPLYHSLAALCAVLLFAGGCGDPAPEIIEGDAGPPPVATCTGDVQCTDQVFCNGVEVCDPDNTEADERGCVAAPAPACGTGERCEESELRCMPDCDVARDADGDGVDAMACGGSDCDDADADRFPGNVEVCDAAGHDEDCDDATFGSRDRDRDGAPDATCCNGSNCGTDCDDSNPAAGPNGSEVCDGVDNDCDTLTDENVSTTFYADADGDGFGDINAAGATMAACTAPAGFSMVATDCADTDAAINPSAFDQCDGIVDDDCSGTVDDPPGGCSCMSGESRACPLPGLCGGGTQNCVSGAWGACSVGAVPEQCNGVDDDCDGDTDEGCTCQSGTVVSCGTEVGACRAGVQTCTGGAFGDCVGATVARDETCNRADDDCDGVVDEDVGQLFFPDNDGDLIGGEPGVFACFAPPGYVSNPGDCFDNDPAFLCQPNNTPFGLPGGLPTIVDVSGDGIPDLYYTGFNPMSESPALFVHLGLMTPVPGVLPTFESFSSPPLVYDIGFGEIGLRDSQEGGPQVSFFGGEFVIPGFDTEIVGFDGSAFSPNGNLMVGGESSIGTVYALEHDGTDGNEYVADVFNFGFGQSELTYYPEISATGTPLAVNPGPYAVGNLDGDAPLEIAYLDEMGTDLTVVNNTVLTTIGGVFSTSAMGAELILVDFDGDGDTDAVRLSEDALHVVFNDGTGDFGGEASLVLNSSDDTIGFANIDSAGARDLVLLTSAGLVFRKITIGPGTPVVLTLGEAELITNDSFFELALLDLDSDEDTDVILVGSIGGLTILQNRGGDF